MYGVAFVDWSGRRLNRGVWTVKGDLDGFVVGDRVTVENTKDGDRRGVIVRVDE